MWCNTTSMTKTTKIRNKKKANTQIFVFIISQIYPASGGGERERERAAHSNPQGILRENNKGSFLILSIRISHNPKCFPTQEILSNSNASH